MVSAPVPCGDNGRRSGEDPLPTSGSRPVSSHGTPFNRSCGVNQGSVVCIRLAWRAIDAWLTGHCTHLPPPREFPILLRIQDAALRHSPALSKLSAWKKKRPRNGHTEDM